MPLNCKKCGWSQDHFWTEHYNPITVLEKVYKFSLLEASLDELILSYTSESYVDTWREFIAKELERAATRIRNMRVRTRAELDQLGLDNVVCPDCGLRGLEVE